MQAKARAVSDRPVRTPKDGYSKDKIKDFVRYCWQGWKTKYHKHRKSQAQESYLRTAVDLLLRGDSRQHLRFPDLFTISLPNKGRSTVGQ